MVCNVLINIFLFLSLWGIELMKMWSQPRLTMRLNPAAWFLIFFLLDDIIILIFVTKSRSMWFGLNQINLKTKVSKSYVLAMKLFFSTAYNILYSSAELAKCCIVIAKLLNCPIFYKQLKLLLVWNIWIIKYCRYPYTDYYKQKYKIQPSV